MKNQLLLISTLVFAGTTSAMALSNIEDKISGYQYTDSTYSYNYAAKGNNTVTGITNYHWNGLKINLGEDARWVLSVNVYCGTNGGQAQPLMDIYLAAASNSILYGNYYGMNVTGGYENGAAGIAHHGGNVSNGDTRTAGSPTFALNGWIGYDQSQGSVDYRPSSLVGGPSRGTNLTDGFYTFRVIVESFKDSGQADLVKFIYEYQGGKKWSREFSISEFGGIAHDRELDVGFYVTGDGGTMRIDQATFDKSTRTLVQAPDPEPTPPTEPEPSTPTDPNVPEPSAFGLLAGLGAIALAASRRRRK